MSLRKEDLIQECATCKGRGEIYDLPDGSARHDCPKCRRTGKIITEEGEAIISLINLAKVHGKINR